MKINRQKGFTLIELLVVIAIIGILSSVVLASLNTAREKSRDARRISDVKQLQVALEFYFDDNRTYPANLALLSPSYIPSTPLDPVDGTAYPYVQSGGGTSYHVGADLEQSDHSALDSDRDLDDGTIDGLDTNACDSTGGRYCYDVTP